MKALRYNDKYTALLPVDDLNITELKSVQDIISKYWLIFKPEFHITLIWFDTWESISTLPKESIEEIKNFVLNHFREYKLIAKYTIMKKSCEAEIKGKVIIPSHNRMTLIQECEVVDIESLYHCINNSLWYKILLPFLHITLASWSDYEPYMTRWIWLYSQSDYEKLKFIDL